MKQSPCHIGDLIGNRGLRAAAARPVDCNALVAATCCGNP
jgi:hypothetical protein